jgi:uncharacterized RDD family membrane protein YckC
MTVEMDFSASVPPPGAAAPAPEPVGDLKQYDGKRVIARLIDLALMILPTAVIIAAFSHINTYAAGAASGVIYFFLCEATMAQSVGKRAMGLRVMTRDGRAPSVGAVAVRSVLRVIEDNLLGLIVIVASGRRRQRIGDLLAKTTVGPAVGAVPRPAWSPVLVMFPVAWIVAMILLAQHSPPPQPEAACPQPAACVASR